MAQLKQYSVVYLDTELSFTTDRTKPSSLIGVLRALFREARKNSADCDEFMKAAIKAHELSKLPKSKAAEFDEKEDFHFFERLMQQAPHQ